MNLFLMRESVICEISHLIIKENRPPEGNLQMLIPMFECLNVCMMDVFPPHHRDHQGPGTLTLYTALLFILYTILPYTVCCIS